LTELVRPAATKLTGRAGRVPSKETQALAGHDEVAAWAMVAGSAEAATAGQLSTCLGSL